MSSIKLSPNASGTGIFTISSPNSNNNYTFTLPTETGTVLTNTGPYTASSSASAGAVTIDASNNVGIGTSSPSTKLHVSGDTAELRVSNAANTQYTYMLRDGFYSVGGNLDIYAGGANPIRLRTNASERARIDSSGNLLVGTTTSSARLTVQADSSSVQPVVFNSTAAGTGATSLVRFRRNGTNVGEIEITGSATTYATSSDYRLKHDIAPMTGALAKVAALKPVTYKWNADDSNGEGFIAHELAEVCPGAVTGEKDAVDAEGNIVPQGIDTSFLVATLTAAIQEQQAMIESLTARIAALEAKP